MNKEQRTISKGSAKRKRAGFILCLLISNFSLAFAQSADRIEAMFNTKELSYELTGEALHSQYLTGTIFMPLKAFIFKAGHSGITLLSLDYAVRVHETCSLSLSSAYFIRNDKETLAGFGSDGNLLGNEFLASVIWSPLSDMRFNLGAGLFLPSMGNVAPGTGNDGGGEIDIKRIRIRGNCKTSVLAIASA